MILFNGMIEFNEPVLKGDVQLPPPGKERQDLMDRIEPYNKALEREGSGNRKCTLEITGVYDKSTLEVSMVYDLGALEKGTLDVEQDAVELLERVGIKKSRRSVCIEEVDMAGLRKCSWRNNNIYRRFLGESIHACDYADLESNDHLTKGAFPTSKAGASRMMKMIMPSDSMKTEIGRIYSADDPSDIFYGIPVHYRIKTSSYKVADDMVDRMVRCLYARKRVLSKRITKIFNIGEHCDKDDFEHIINCARGSCVEIVLSGDIATEAEYASHYIRLSEVLSEVVKEASNDTEFFFVENECHPGFAGELLNRLSGDLDIIEIDEGKSDKKVANKYFRSLIRGSKIEKYADNADLFEDDKRYTPSDVMSIYIRWQKEMLKANVYTAYKEAEHVAVTTDNKAKGSSYEELKNLIGLKEVKRVVDEIIAEFKMQKVRAAAGCKENIAARHMIFTGTPGTAKTTVARLLAGILHDNDVLPTGGFVECGRGDLVGEYVGWTAKKVRQCFERAKGGVLFIDEAYSLAEERKGMFGDEAINTIVQEMENHREEMIVIFAGYPDKMKDLLSRNEGLRSRIAFHVDFPDYSADELLQILEKLAGDRSLSFSQEAKDRARDLFEEIRREPEFGNGRFARNLLEQSLNRQSVRLMNAYGGDFGDVDKDEVSTITADDLDTNIVRNYEGVGAKAIGF